MRLIKPALAFVILAALLGCAHQPVPAAARPLPMTGVSAQADGSGPERARALVAAKFTEPATQIVSVTISETGTPQIYQFTCYFRRTEFGKVCMYVAQGQVDVESALFKATHRVSTCLGAERI